MSLKAYVSKIQNSCSIPLRWAGVKGPKRNDVQPNEDFLTKNDEEFDEQNYIMEPAKPLQIHARFSLCNLTKTRYRQRFLQRLVILRIENCTK